LCETTAHCAGHWVEQQYGVTAMYDGISVGECFVALLVEQAIMVELKTVRQINIAHRGQCLN
jgi:GxxExxY protein